MGLISRIRDYRSTRYTANLTRSIDSFADHPGLTEQLLAVQGLRSQPYRTVAVRELLSVPAIERALTLIASLIGQLPMQGWRQGQLMNPTPTTIARPDPFLTPRDFKYGIGWNMASRGEAILYAASVIQGEPVTVLNLPLAEVQVDWKDGSQLERKYSWRGRELDGDRVKHCFYAYRPGELRGVGPLQMVGAAFSVAVEADEWAARYFAEGGLTLTHLHSEAGLTDEEADAIRDRWISNRSAVRVTSGGVLTAAALGTSPKDAQMVEQRMHNKGEVATAFGIPGKLLEYAMSGSSLTYENVGDLMTEFARMTLSPSYLVPIEQTFSDFLTRSTIARFDLSELQRADPMTRYEIHKIAIDSGIYDAAYAAASEGIDKGAPSMVTAPIPAPQASAAGIPSADGSGATFAPRTIN